MWCAEGAAKSQACRTIVDATSETAPRASMAKVRTLEDEYVRRGKTFARAAVSRDAEESAPAALAIDGRELELVLSLRGAAICLYRMGAGW